jgi:hypothetical protein
VLIVNRFGKATAIRCGAILELSQLSNCNDVYVRCGARVVHCQQPDRHCVPDQRARARQQMGSWVTVYAACIAHHGLRCGAVRLPSLNHRIIDGDRIKPDIYRNVRSQFDIRVSGRLEAEVGSAAIRRS